MHLSSLTAATFIANIILLTTFAAFSVESFSLRSKIHADESNLSEETNGMVTNALLKKNPVVDIGGDDDGYFPPPNDKSKTASWSDMKRTLIAELTTYPGYSNNKTKNGVLDGQVTVMFEPEGSFKFRYRLKGLGYCEDCKVGIHLGKTCDIASAVGGSFWNSDVMRNNPWEVKSSPAVYNTSHAEERRERSSTGFFDMDTGYGFDETKGHAVVFLDSYGRGASCGTLQSGLLTMIKKEVILSSRIYPDARVDSRRSVGEVGVFYKLNGSFTLKYNMGNLPANCRNCKVQILLGTICDETNEAGPNYWNSNKLMVDPWSKRGSSAVYTTSLIGNTTGEFEFYNGFEQMDTNGHAIVFRDERDDIVACGTLEFTLAYLMKSIFD